uniref:Alpha-type protein kinase domain-containing protein n=1 Tax=Hanusia phi TaxID=3032 RepID=A0A7S0HCJ6_9CRYP|mmetsp:Transcript_12891/g.29666  ORF Transcript_12891/g.29666 Transcript_12891/m.29666 type:complete len:767 (+) Transcript_12891:22-2322(+)
MAADKSKQHHALINNAIFFAVAAATPALLGRKFDGVAILPFLYVTTFRIRKAFLFFWVFPLVCLAMFAVDKQLDVKNIDLQGAYNFIAPILVSVVLHYGGAYFASEWRVTSRAALDEFSESVSGFLDRKCYKEKSWPSLFYMKAERVLISFVCILKIILAVAFLVFFLLFNGIPSDLLGCGATDPKSESHLKIWLWAFYGIVCATEIMYHMALYMSNQISCAIGGSFTMAVLQPTYWQWFFIASYAPSKGLWIPILTESLRTCSVSFFRMQDKDDVLVSPLMSLIEFFHVLIVIALGKFSSCSYSDAMLYRELFLSCFFLYSMITFRYKKWRTWSKARKPVHARLYFPVHHKEIECYVRKWQKGINLPEGGGDVEFPDDHPAWKKMHGKPNVKYFPELSISRKESRPDWGSEVPKFVTFERKTQMPGEWICVEIGTEAGILLDENEMDTGLKGQFRVLHPLVDCKGVLAYWGDFGAGKLFAAKRYKKDPAGGWDMAVPGDDATEAELSAARNRHVRLLKPYFQDCLMQEKAAEFGRAFNKVENLPVRKVELLRACVLEMEWESALPQLYLVEPFLDDNTPFRKFNNNEYVPGQQAVQNTPNMLSLFSYFHSDRQLLLCDVQGKKYKFTDPQFHSSEKDSAEDDDYEEGELRDWLHSDGGIEMMKRVLVGLHEQKSLHALCNRVWPEKMREFNKEVEQWKEDPEFKKLLEQWEKEARLYRKYFANLNPVLDAGVGGMADMEEELDEAMKSSLMSVPTGQARSGSVQR